MRRSQAIVRVLIETVQTGIDQCYRRRVKELDKHNPSTAAVHRIICMRAQVQANYMYSRSSGMGLQSV